ncbi:MAG: hypothetical protein ACKO7N_04910 [Candidatus Nitrosotenuis sp.]
MATYEEYLRAILKQVADSNLLLENLRDKPGDLEIINRELAKINGLFIALANKLEANKQELIEYQYILSPIRKYLQNNEFFREMKTMSMLYSDDAMRLKNLRMSILESLKENNLLEHILNIVRQ